MATPVGEVSLQAKQYCIAALCARPARKADNLTAICEQIV
jgi:hypothetical protein